MILTRANILTTLQAHLEAEPAVLALWLEGADATGYVDAYSDIDVCCSVTPGALEAVTALARAALESLGELDLNDSSYKDSDFLSTTFHLKSTSPYLLVDFDVFVQRGSTFTTGDTIEKPRVLFDRAGVIQFRPPDYGSEYLDPAARLRALEVSIAQYSRVEKYILRGEFLEAFGYYHKWLLTPLVEALRLRYTPLHPDYYIVHISRHLPKDALARLEALFQVSSLAELAVKSRQALAFYHETAAYVISHPVQP